MYHELIVKIAIETMKGHGYELPVDSDAYENNPVIRRYFSDAAKALETVDRFLSANGKTFADLAVSNYYHSEKTSQLIEPPVAPQTQPAESVKTASKLAEPSRMDLYRSGKLLEVQVYFDSNNICLGVHGKNFAISYKGMFAYGVSTYLEAGLNPVGKHVNKILGEDADKTFEKNKAANHTDFKNLKKSERDLLQFFVGREIEFERFRVIKQELLKVYGIKIGPLISTQSDIKAWFATAGNDRAALYWTPSNGWEIDTRHNQTELTGIFEGFDLIEALEVNDVECNGISANDWHNARDEDAEAEAVALQAKSK